jgi:HEAT repeat protein
MIFFCPTFFMTNMTMPKLTVLLASILITLAGCKSSDAPQPEHLTNAPKPPPSYPLPKPMPLDPALQAKARQEIETELHSVDEVMRSHALETVKLVMLPDADKKIIPAMDDPSPLVRKSAALAAGELRLKDAEPAAREHLETALISERMADIFVLHQLGDTQYSHEFEAYAFDPDPAVRGDAALILGLVGNPSAIPILRTMMKEDKDPSVALQAAEALWKMGDEHGLEELIGATVSKYPDDQMIALLALAGRGDPQVLGHIQGSLNDDYLVVALVAARAAGMLGCDYGYGVALKGAKSTDARERFLAAMAFGAIGRSDSQPELARMLKDQVPDVRLAAAGSLLMLK